MIGYEVSEQDKAVLACFSKAAEAEGLDGTYALSPVERGILATVDLVRAQTLLQVFAALKIGGRAAAASIAVPDSVEEAQKQLRELFKAA
jgi:hypothetical protein